MKYRIAIYLAIIGLAAFYFGPVFAHSPAVDDGGSLFTTSEDAVLVTGNVLDNDTGTTKSVQSFNTTGTLGIVAYNGNGTFTYDPNGKFGHLNNGQNATDSFTYVLDDGSAPDQAKVTITITGVSPPPSNAFAEFASSVGPGEFKIVPGSELYSHFSWPSTVQAEIGQDAVALCARINCNIAHGQLDIYSGAAWGDNTIWLPPAGGHGNSYQGSGVMRYTFGDDWDRLTHPTRLYTQLEADADPANGYLADRNGDGINDDCLNFLDGNQAVHTYDAVIKIPNSNKIVVGGVTAMCWQETTQAQTAPWVVWTFDTATLKTERLPLLDQWNNYSTSAFSETVQYPGKAPGALYWKGNNTFVVVVATDWNDTSTWEVVQEVSHTNPLPIGYGSMMVMGDRLLFNDQYSLNAYTISLDGTVDYTTRTRLINFSENWPAGWGAWFANRGMAVSGDKIVFWDGRHRIEVYDTVSGSRSFLPQVCNPAPYTSLGVFNKWEYLPEHDVFMGLSSSSVDGGVVLYRLGTYADGVNAWNMADQLDCDPYQPPDPPIQQGVIYEEGFDGPPFPSLARCGGTLSALEAEGCRYGDTRWTTRSHGSGYGPGVVDGQLRYETHRDGLFCPACAGFYQADFGSITGRTFRPGDTFEIQFDYILAPNFFEDYFRTAQGNVTGHKIIIVGTGDVEGRNPTSSCTSQELVMINGWDGKVTFYHSCNWFEGATVSAPNPYIWEEQPGGDHFCPGYIAHGVRALPGSVPDTCFKLKPGKTTFNFRVTIGGSEWQWDRQGEKKSLVEIWATVDGVKTKILTWPLYINSPAEGYRETGGIGKVWPMIYTNDVVSGPETWVAYDNLVVCDGACL